MGQPPGIGPQALVHLSIYQGGGGRHFFGPRPLDLWLPELDLLKRTRDVCCTIRFRVLLLTLNPVIRNISKFGNAIVCADYPHLCCLNTQKKSGRVPLLQLWCILPRDVRTSTVCQLIGSINPRKVIHFYQGASQILLPARRALRPWRPRCGRAPGRRRPCRHAWTPPRRAEGIRTAEGAAGALASLKKTRVYLIPLPPTWQLTGAPFRRK